MLQEYIMEKNKNRINFIDKNIASHNDVDADYIIDCTGTPKNLDNYWQADYIPVNAALVKQCSWDKPEYTYTLTKAMKNGWMFGIPLANRVSFGYLYNSSFNDIEEIELELDKYIESVNLSGDLHRLNINFNNYFHKNNFSERVFYNGNASFFLEPMEATSLATVEEVNRKIFDVINGKKSIEKANKEYIEWFKEVQDIIVMHYLAGSKYKTEFWHDAVQKATKCLSIKTNRWQEILYNLNNPNYVLSNSYGCWSMPSIKSNIDNLDIAELL